MEWKPIDVPGLKHQYGIYEDGTIFRISTGGVLKAGYRITFIMEDGTSKRFYRKKLLDNAFPKNKWVPIAPKIDGIKPIYEISPDGKVRRSDTGRIFSGEKRIMLTMEDGSHKHFFRYALVNAVYNESSDIKFDDDVIQLMNDIDEHLKKKYKNKIIFTIMKAKVKDMFSVHCDRFDYPISIRKECGKYTLRTGKNWNNPLYYGSENDVTYHYHECEYDELMDVIHMFINRKLRSYRWRLKHKKEVT